MHALLPSKMHYFDRKCAKIKAKGRVFHKKVLSLQSLCKVINS